MPLVSVKDVDSQLRTKHPREYSLLFQFGGSADGVDSQVGPCACARHGRSSSSSSAADGQLPCFPAASLLCTLQVLLDAAKSGYGDAGAVEKLLNGGASAARGCGTGLHAAISALTPNTCVLHAHAGDAAVDSEELVKAFSKPSQVWLWEQCHRRTCI